MDYEKKVAEALEELKQHTRLDTEPAITILKLFPELEESDYVIKRRLRHLLDYFRSRGADHDICDKILKWLDKQDEQKSTDKIEPKFRIGDVMRTLEETKYNYTNGMPVVVSIDEEYYRCTNESIAIKDQDKYEYPPINRKEEKSNNEITHKN